MRTLFMSVWISGNILLTLTAVVMFWRKAAKTYPAFFAYLVYSAAFVWLNLALFYRFGGSGYAYGYWIGTVGYTVLAFVVLREVFIQIFRPYESLREFGNILFRWAAVVLVLIGIVMTISSKPGSETMSLYFLMTIERSIGLMQCGLVIFMLLFAGQLGLTFRHRLFGISIGFGVIASCELMFTTLQAYGTISLLTLSLAKMVSEIIGYIIWTSYMCLAEPERRQSASLAHAASWNNELTGANYGNSGSAFLPNIVDTVERVLSRRTATEIYMHTAGGSTSLPN